MQFSDNESANPFPFVVKAQKQTDDGGFVSTLRVCPAALDLSSLRRKARNGRKIPCPTLTPIPASASYFVQPLVEHYDRAKFEFYGYSWFSRDADAMQNWFAQRLDVFRHNPLIADRAAAQLIATHGGSLRLFACKRSAARPRSSRVDEFLQAERIAGLDSDEAYRNFAVRVLESKRALIELLVDIKRQGRTIACYGAPAKGNTLLNYCGVGRDLLAFTVDRSPQKQGMYLPGSRLPIMAPEAISLLKPDFVLILPWNIKDEIMQQMAHIQEWGGRFIVPMPRAEIL